MTEVDVVGEIVPTASRSSRLRAWFDRSFVGRCLIRYERINGAQQAAFIALNALLGLVPMILMTVALLRKAGIRSIRIDQTLIHKLDLTGPVVQSVRGAFSTSGGQARAITIVAVLGGATTVIGFCGSIWRLFNAAMAKTRLPGLRASARGFVWLCAATAIVVLIQLCASASKVLSGTIFHHPARDIVRIIGASVIWLVSPRILITKRIPWRSLVPGAIFGGLTSGLVIILSNLYVPSLMNSYAVPFGAFGVAIALGFWIWMIAGVVVIGAIVMAELAGLERSSTRE